MSERRLPISVPLPATARAPIRWRAALAAGAVAAWGGAALALETLGDIAPLAALTLAALGWAGLLFPLGWIAAARERAGLPSSTALPMQALDTERDARLAHDLKNVMQAMQGLALALDACPGDARSAEALLRRQLPALAVRLDAALAELDGRAAACDATPVVVWWQALADRYAATGVVFVADGEPGLGSLPRAVYDGVADHLIGNALKKRAAAGTQIEVRFDAVTQVLTVSDDGEPVPTGALAGLFVRPQVSTTGGQGIGLALAARLAQRRGFSLVLAENRRGRVCFRLAA